MNTFKNDNNNNAWAGFAIFIAILLFMDGMFGSRVLFNIVSALTTGSQCKF